jgi:hypothetical protein
MFIEYKFPNIYTITIQPKLREIASKIISNNYLKVGDFVTAIDITSQLEDGDLILDAEYEILKTREGGEILIKVSNRNKRCWYYSNRFKKV